MPKVIARLPDQSVLRDLFDYSFIEGALYWKKRLSPKAKLRVPAGSTDPEGYFNITINRKTYRRHRLVWTYFNSDPEDLEIDHINRVKGDDRIENLRLATRQQNSYNILYSTNRSGYTGVCWHKRDKKWRVSIRRNGVNVHLGYYANLDEAKEAYIKASLDTHRTFSPYALN